MPGSALCDVCAERFADNLHAIADDWEALELRIAGSDARGIGDEKVKGSRLQFGIALNEMVVQTRSEVAGWMHFVARVVLENPRASAPDDTTVPGLARWVATWHASAITHHEDIDLVAALAQEARDHKRNVNKRAYPGESRRVDLRHHKCAVTVEGEQGEPKRCGGHYFAIVNPAALDRPDLICTENDSHRIPPSQWARHNLLRPLDNANGSSWLTSQEAAVKLGTSVDNVYNLARREAWEKRITGRTVRYSEQAVNSTIEARDRQPAAVGAGI